MLLAMSLANRFKNLYRGQLFNFCLLLLRFFPLKISLLEMLIAFGNDIRFQKSDIRDQILEIRFHKSNFNKNRFFQKSDFRHDCYRCPQLTDSRTFTKGNFSFVVTAAASSPSKFHSKRCSLLLAMKSDFSH